MSEVNADGTLIEPHRHLLQEAQFLTNGLMAEDPEGAEEETMERSVHARNGGYAGQGGGAPHMPAATAAPPGTRPNRPKHRRER